MPDPLRTEGARALDDASQADRDAKIEQLLVAGLDHYFARRYDEAIDVWTRTLFFDRSHARARAYIERARTALAERERHSEELLHGGAAALDRGEDAEARRLLEAAVEHGAQAVDVTPLLDRLTRQAPITVRPSQSPWPPGDLGASTDARPPVPPRPGPATRAWAWTGAIALALVVAVAVAARRSGLDPIAAWGVQDSPVISPAPPAPPAGLPLPRRSEMALGRARVLAARGQLHQALALLETVRPTDPEKAEADSARADIQRQLLAIGGRRP